VVFAMKLLPMSTSFAFVVVTEPLLSAVPVVLEAPTDTSSAPLVAMPLYSRMRISGVPTVALKATVTVLAPAAAALMFCA
jgi:hypothetical protein